MRDQSMRARLRLGLALALIFTTVSGLNLAWLLLSQAPVRVAETRLKKALGADTFRLMCEATVGPATVVALGFAGSGVLLVCGDGHRPDDRPCRTGRPRRVANRVNRLCIGTAGCLRINGLGGGASDDWRFAGCRHWPAVWAGGSKHSFCETTHDRARDPASFSRSGDMHTGRDGGCRAPGGNQRVAWLRSIVIDNREHRAGVWQAIDLLERVRSIRTMRAVDGLLDRAKLIPGVHAAAYSSGPLGERDGGVPLWLGKDDSGAFLTASGAVTVRESGLFWCRWRQQ